MKKQIIPRLTDLEVVIMAIFWEQEKELTIQDLATHIENKKISVGSVTQAVNHLLEKKALVVSDVIVVNHVYARAFLPTFTRDEYLGYEFYRMQKSIFGGTGSPFAVAAAFMQDGRADFVSQKEVDQLDTYIDKKRKHSKNGEN